MNADAMRARLLSRSGGALQLDGVDLARAAEAFGTPAYIYSAAAVRARYRAIADAARASAGDLDPLIAYSVKANSSAALLHILAKEGAAFDVVSGGELIRVVRAGGDAGRIIFAGVGKTDEELALAVRAGVFQINVESLGELARLERAAAAAGAQARAALRVNPAIDPRTHPHLATSAPTSKFGMAAGEAAAALARRAEFPHVDFAGIHVHLGSMLQDAGLWREAFEKIQPLFASFPGGRPATLDIGGGLAIDTADRPGLDPAAWFAAVAPLLRAAGARPILEPGRWIAAPSGLLLTRVLDIKNAGGVRMAVVDAAMNDLIRPALYGAVHPIEPVADGGEPRSECDVVGPVCESGDFLGRKVVLPDLRPGALLAVLDAGAYGFSMASTYNSRPKPVELLVDAGRARIIRARESLDDLLRGECV